MIDSPWFARAFNAGQALRLSPAFGATYAGHFPSAPGVPRGVTCPIFRLNVTILINDNTKSQIKMKRVWKMVARNMVIVKLGMEREQNQNYLVLYTQVAEQKGAICHVPAMISSGHQRYRPLPWVTSGLNMRRKPRIDSDGVKNGSVLRLSAVRTPESPLGGHIRKFQKIRFFIRTILANFYPEIGSALRLANFYPERGYGIYLAI